MQNYIIRKNDNVFPKKSEEYFVLFDVQRRSLFCYKKDTKVIWDNLDIEMSISNLYLKLITKEYEVSERVLEDLICDMSKRGLIICNSITADEDFIEKNNTLREYVEYCNERNMVNNVLVEVTNQCNLQCIHCYHDMKTTRLSLECLKRFLADLRETYVLEITLSGGEIILYPFWKEIIKMAYKNGVVVSIISNFTLMSDEDADYIINSNVNVIKTSLYSCVPEIHDNITGVKGSYKKTVSRLKYFLKKGKAVEVNVMIMKTNYHTLVDTKKFLEELGATIFFDYRIYPSRTNKKDITPLIIDEDEFYHLYREKIVAAAVKAKCMACRNRVRVNQEGEVMACEFLNISLGNINTQGINAILQNEKSTQIIERIDEYKPKRCKTCRYEERCQPCPAFEWIDDLYAKEGSDIMCYYTKISSV